MLGNLYDRALDGERCWVRHDDGRLRQLPVRSWLGGQHADRRFDNAVLGLCKGPTIDLGCGPGRLVARLIERGVPALGVDQSATAVGLARRSGAPALVRDVFEPLPGTGRWQTVLLADGNVGLGGDPWRVLSRAGELLKHGGRSSPSSMRPIRVSILGGCDWSPGERSGHGSGGRPSESTARHSLPRTSAWWSRAFTRSVAGRR